MDRGNAPDDCKPQAYPAGAARSRYVGPIEAFEDPGEMLRRDASSVIRDLDADRLGIGKRSQCDAAVFRRVCESVRDKIAKSALQQGAVNFRGDRTRRIYSDVNTLLLCRRLVEVLDGFKLLT